MGNCWAGDVRGGRQAVGGGDASDRGGGSRGAAGPNDAVELFLKSRALNDLSSQIEVRPPLPNLEIIEGKRRETLDLRFLSS